MKTSGMSIVEMLVAFLFLSLLVFVIGDAVLTGKKTAQSYGSMEDEYESILSPMQTLKNDLRYADSITKILGVYTITYRQYDESSVSGYLYKSISYQIAPDGTAPDLTPNYKVVRILTDLSTLSSRTSEYKQLAGVSWCVDGIDAAADCPLIDKVGISERRFIAEFKYRAGLKQQGLKSVQVVINLENMPPDGGFVNPILVKP